MSTMSTNDCIIIDRNKTGLYNIKAFSNEKISELNLVEKDINEAEANVVPFSNKFSLLTSDFFKHMQKILIQDSHADLDMLLPKNCRFFKDLTHKKIFVIEEQPRIRTIFIDFNFEAIIEKLKIEGKIDIFNLQNFLQENKSPYKISLSFPYIIYIFIFDGPIVKEMKVFFKLSPFGSLEDDLLKPNLTNINTNYSVCLGEITNKYTYGNCNETIEAYINAFWKNIFNKDYSYHYIDYEREGPLELSDFLTWSYYSMKDPMFIFNVNWLKANVHLKGLVETLIQKKIKKNRQNIIGYFDIVSFFSEGIDVVDELEISEEGEEYYTLVESFSKNLYLNDRILSVGDSVKFNNGRVKYIYSLIFKNSFENNFEEVRYINFEDRENSKVVKYKLTNKFMQYMNQIFDTNSLSEIILKNGVTIKSGDIIKITFPIEGIYNKVNKIRINYDGKAEIITDNYNYLSDSIVAEHIDLNNIVLNNGTKLEIGKKYYFNERMKKSRRIFSPIIHFYKLLKFVAFDTETEDNVLGCIFENSNKEVEIYDINSFFNYHNIVNETENNDANMVSTVRNGLYLQHSSKNLIINVRKDGYYIDQLDKLDYNRNFNIQDILADDHVKIRSFDLDIQFSLGDKVIFVDWRNPVDMLKIRQITNFSVNDFHHLVISMNSNDNINYEKNFISFRTGIINAGTIRHVSSEYNGVKVGTKIKAKVKGIKCFPKSKANIIVAFLTDTGCNQPLVLCSNCCTIWFDDLLENFELYTKDMPSWSKINHDSILFSTFGFQGGDIFETMNNNITMLENSSYEPLHKKYLVNIIKDEYSHSYARHFRKNGIISRYGILNPRKSLKQIVNQNQFKKVIPTFHNSYTEIKDTNVRREYGIMVDPKEIINIIGE